jgi:hypothetical protein
MERLTTSRRHWKQQEATGSNRKQQEVAAVYSPTTNLTDVVIAGDAAVHVLELDLGHGGGGGGDDDEARAKARIRG